MWCYLVFYDFCVYVQSGYELSRNTKGKGSVLAAEQLFPPRPCNLCCKNVVIWKMLLYGILPFADMFKRLSFRYGFFFRYRVVVGER